MDIASGKETISLESPKDQFPSLADIDIHRLVLERRSRGSRLLVDFSAYTPGVLELPPVEIGSWRFAGLRVTVNSIIQPGSEDSSLSLPAPPLAIPGTALLVYGSLGAFVLVLLFSLWLAFRGKGHLKRRIEKWRRRRLIVSMAGMEKRLRKTLQKEGRSLEVLNLLSAEFRTFLSFFAGTNCRALTAAELGRLPPLASGEGPGGDFLGPFFRRCDELRFGGGNIPGGEAFAVLCDLRLFLGMLESAEKMTRRREENAA
jgi:hypothetical protein